MADVETYVELEEVKQFLSIENNNEDDELLETLILDANQEIELRLKPYAESFPLIEEFFSQATKAGMYHVNSCYREHALNGEAADRLMKKFEKKMVTLIGALKAVPTERTKTILISTDSRDSKVILPTQASIFAFDDF